MTKRRATRIDDGSLELGTKTPVGTDARKEVSPITEVKIPRAQAFWVALPLAVAVVVSLVAPIALGPRIFWVVCGVCALAAFLWSVQFELAWQDRATLPLLVGVVALCFWKFADWQGWRVPETWQPWAALWAVFALVFWWTFVLALWLTFVQRLGMPMFHQQFHVWKALGNALESFLGIAMKQPPTPSGPRPIFNRSDRRAEPELPEREVDPIEELSEFELFLRLSNETGIIKRDATHDRDGSVKAPGLAGMLMANGQKVTKPLWGRCMGILHEQGYVTNGGSGYDWATGQSAQTALDALV